ncbi:MAG: hypothetical protein GY909_06270 [Oligoflexia bacterium]|nr:hypothetical protein [Oligoflexia bacterium]
MGVIWAKIEKIPGFLECHSVSASIRLGVRVTEGVDMKNVFLMMILAIFFTSCVGTYQKSICNSNSLVDTPIEGVYIQKELSNGHYVPIKKVQITKVQGHTGIYSYEVIQGSGVNRVIKSCVVSNELILEFKNYKGLVMDQHMTFAKPFSTETGFGMFMTEYYTDGNGTSQTLDNREMDAYETFQHFSFRKIAEVIFEKSNQ